MKFAAMLCAGALLFGSSATAQEGGKAISTTTKTSISLGTATQGFRTFAAMQDALKFAIGGASAR